MHQRAHLLFDADDTLWEDNVYFEEAIDEFIALLAHTTLPADHIRRVLDDIERRNCDVHGYGATQFTRNLCECYRALDGATLERLHEVEVLGDRVRTRPREVIAGVPETLDYLAQRHDTILLTKGDPDEQRAKIESSALSRFFRRVVIVREKSPSTFAELAAHEHFEPHQTWMIGNSPRSDINPALAAGLNAVFIPHAVTWVLEHQELAANDGRLLILERFADLKRHF